MEKEEKSANYMEEIKTRFEKMRDLREESEKLKSALFNAEEAIKRTEECTEAISQFKSTIDRTNTGSGWEVIVAMRNARCTKSEWETLYSYKMSNFDDLMCLIEDRLYKKLEDAIYYVKNSRKELTKTTD